MPLDVSGHMKTPDFVRMLNTKYLILHEKVYM